MYAYSSEEAFSLGGWISVAITLYTSRFCFPLIAILVATNSISNITTILRLKMIIESLQSIKYIIPIHNVETDRKSVV